MKKFFLFLTLLTLGVGQMWGAKTYQLTAVTSVSAGNKYVFVQEGHAMNATITSSALQTTSPYSSSGLSGTEAYIWTLESATGGFYLKNVSKGNSSPYLNNSSSTSVSFGNKSSIWSISFSNGVAIISNTSNSNRYLGFTNSTSYAYKAYATSNMSYAHAITVYLLEEETTCSNIVTITKGTPESGGSFNLDKTGQQNCCSALTVTVSNITAPSGKQFSAITQSGINSGVTIDQNAKTVTYAANSSGSSTINVTFVDLPKYTVTLMDDNDTRTQASYGAAVTLPSRAGCTGYTFAGWTKTWTSAQGSWTTTAPTIINSNSYTPTADENLYPVYTKTEGGGALQTVTIFEETCSGRPTATSSITNSDTDWDDTGGGLTGVSISGSARTYNSGITNPPCFGFTSTNYKDLTISGINTSGYSNLTLSYLIKGNQSGGTYANYTVSTNAASNNSVELTTSGTATTCSTASALSSLSLPATSSLTLTFTAGSNITNRAFYVDDIKITGQTGGSTTYFISVPNCCTQLDQINGSVSLTQLTEGVNAGKLQASWPSQANTNGWASPGIVIKIYEDGNATPVVTSSALANNSTSFTATGFTPKTCTQYYATLTATHGSDASYCAGDLVSDPSAKVTTAGYSYGITKEHVSLKQGESETANTCAGGFLAEYVADAGYALPGTISVSGASIYDWEDGVLAIDAEDVTGNVTVTIAGTCVPPVIGTQPAASASYQQGATPAALSVAATLGSGTLTYLWKVSTDNGDTWSNASGTNNAATYAAANISTANTGTTKYKCIVGNQQGGCEVESDVATIEVTAPSKCLTPTFTVAAGTYYEDKSVELGCNTAGVTIYYTTNNTTPTTSSSVYSSAISVTQTTTIKAIAVKAGLINSDVAEATYTIKCETPTIVLAAGNYTGVQTTTITKGYGTKIYYTTDGSTPSNTNGTEYTGAVSIDQPMTLKAIVWKDGCTNSEVASAAYTLKCTTPTFNNGTGTYTGAQSITLSGTAGADIYYTLDGTDPSKTHGTKYTAAIEVSANQTVKAIAVKEGWGDSEIASATYTIQYNVYWWVNGTDWNDKGGSTLVTYGQTATAPTTAPTKANGCGDKFMGWTTIPDYEDDDTAPTGMFTETSAAITGETNFYAVFADYGEEE